jgi:hypothetical protein
VPGTSRASQSNAPVRAGPGPSRRLALWGLALAGVSIAALVITGIAMAAGADPAGACGGG